MVDVAAKRVSLSHLHQSRGYLILSYLQQGLSPVEWESHVMRALDNFQTALNIATTKYDKASATKGYALALRKLAYFHNKLVPRKWCTQRILYQFR